MPALHHQFVAGCFLRYTQTPASNTKKTFNLQKAHGLSAPWQQIGSAGFQSRWRFKEAQVIYPQQHAADPRGTLLQIFEEHCRWKFCGTCAEPSGTLEPYLRTLPGPPEPTWAEAPKLSDGEKGFKIVSLLAVPCIAFHGFLTDSCPCATSSWGLQLAAGQACARPPRNLWNPP